jgi:hypothetical protein
MTKAQKARLDYIKTRHKPNYTLEGVDLALVDSQAGDVISIWRLIRKSDEPREIEQIMR